MTGFPQELDADVTSRLRDIHLKGEHKGRDCWHCHNLGKCRRQRVMERAGFTKAEKSPESMLTLEYGHMLEKLVVGAWRHRHPLTQGEVVLPRLDLVGHFDALFVGERAVADVKTTHQGSLRYHIGGNREYRMQVAAYCLAIQENGIPMWMVPPFSPEKSLIYYIGKDNGVRYIDEFDWRGYISLAEEDIKRINGDWKRWLELKVLPDEEEFVRIGGPNNKHVKGGRGKVGDMAPPGLCNPEYCDYLTNHCPTIANWWATRGGKHG